MKIIQKFVLDQNVKINNYLHQSYFHLYEKHTNEVIVFKTNYKHMLI